MAKAPKFDSLQPDQPLEQAARIVLSGLLEAVFAEVPAVLGGEDVRATHDMRVAFRRLRSALATFCDALPRKRLRRFTEATRRVGRQLGAVRDADVHLAALRTALAGATVQETAGIVYALERVSVGRRRALANFAIELSQYDRDGFLAFLRSDDGADPR
jgi:CHAD domain-containing protein